MIAVVTAAQKTYHIVPAGTQPKAIALTATPNTAPKHLAPTSARWLGKPEATIAGWVPPVEPNAEDGARPSGPRPPVRT